MERSNFMSTASEGHAGAIANREISSSRVFDVPRDLVFEAWTDPDHLSRWWGPKGCTSAFHEFGEDRSQ
jgi:uncharacterized protein YndB with AHSA1/START domain